MTKRGFIRVDDDAQRAKLDQLADQLRSLGMTVTDVAPIVGQITGTADESKLGSIQQHVATYGGRFILDEDDVEHRLPDPESDTQ